MWLPPLFCWDVIWLYAAVSSGHTHTQLIKVDILANYRLLDAFMGLSSHPNRPAWSLAVLNQLLWLYLQAGVNWAPQWWSGGVLSLKRPTLPADWCQSQACVDTRDQGEEEGGGGTLRAGSGARGPSFFPLVLESNEVKGVKVSGSRMRTRLIVGRSNLRPLRAAHTALPSRSMLVFMWKGSLSGDAS